MYSDRGTNFVGAETELRRDLKQLDHQHIAKQFVSSELEWQFNPPASPHMGGSWERLIRIVKSALYASMPKLRLVNEEVLRSFLTEVEFTINSRPLTHLQADKIGDPLTPNHFIFGDSGGVKPMGPIIHDGEVLVNSWRKSQQMASRFWDRWIKEYLPTLSQRSKWHKKAEPLAIDDIVLLVDEALPRNTWLKGRILDVSTAKDGQVRSATVQTINGIYRRPAVKLAKINLQINDNNQQTSAAGGV